MSFKDLNLNKGFNKPKYKEIDKLKLEQKKIKNDGNIPTDKFKFEN